MAKRDEKCGNCYYWDDQRCHKYAPKPTDERKLNWPTTKGEDWCGEFRRLTGEPQIRTF